MHRRRWMSFMFLLATAAGAAPPRLPYRQATFDLPGQPAAIVSTDLDGDGQRDFLVVSARASWGEVVESHADAAGDVIDVLPALFDKRELHILLGSASGELRRHGPGSELPAGVRALEAGPDHVGAVALTDDGLARLTPTTEGFAFEPLLTTPSALAGSKSFLPSLPLVGDRDGRPGEEILLPLRDRWQLHRADGTLATSIAMPSGLQQSGRFGARTIPLPAAIDVDGDGSIDWLIAPAGDSADWRVTRGRADGTFADRFEPIRLPAGRRAIEIAELDGRPGAEVVSQATEPPAPNKKNKNPRTEYRLHRLAADLAVDGGTPFLVQGSITPSGPEQSAFRDFDGDGRKDFLAVDFDVSTFAMIKALATRRLTVELTFRVHRQPEPLRFVAGAEMSEKLKLDLSALKLGRLGYLAGDFDGDGRIDYSRIELDRRIEIRRGRADGAFGRSADYEIALTHEPTSLALVRIDDYDGDGLSDLIVTRLGAAGASIDFSLSKGAR